jgi:hypothetical protein
MTTTIAQAQPTAAAVDPTEARHEFFFNLELMELTMVIPQAATPAQPVNKY